MIATGAREHRRVRVWFGRHVIADYIADAALAARYEAAMRRRFAGLRVTTEDRSGPGEVAERLPSERLWGADAMTAAAAGQTSWLNQLRRRLALWYGRVNEIFRRWMDEDDRWQ